MNEQRERFLTWLQAESARCAHEWSKWDGSVRHGEQINDMQCDRIDAAKQRLGTPHGLMTDEEIQGLQ